MELGLQGKVVLITGSSKGLGRAMAEEFAAEGCHLALCARGEAGLDDVAKTLQARHSSKTLLVAANLAELSEVKRLVAKTVAHFGRIDVLVNNAGSITGGSITAKPDDELQRDWALKLYGYVRVSREVFPVMIKQGGGRIINIVGIAGKEPGGFGALGGNFPSGMANAALLNLTKALAFEGAKHKILVNAVNPGLIRTERTIAPLRARAAQLGQDVEELIQARAKSQLLGRDGEPSEVAAVAVFLASQRASYMTGSVVTVDGGATQGF